VGAEIIRLHAHVEQQTIRALEVLLQHAHAGQLKGLVFASKYAGRSDVGATGDYRRDPDSGIGAAVKLIDALKALPPA
jgi:hypothetical protein